MKTWTNTLTLAVITATLALAGCTEDEPVTTDEARPLKVEFTEEFRIGDDPAERQFTRISSMAFAPNGHAVVGDRDEFAIVVFDRGGREVLEWGGQGEGPGEFESEPEQVVVSDGGRVVVRRYRQVDVFTSAGELIGSHLVDHPVDEIAFDDEGNVLGQVAVDASFFSEEERQYRLVRLRDEEVLWSFPVLPPSPRLAFFQPRPITAGLDDARVAVAINDRYEIDILDTSTGRVLDRITRNLTPRATPEALEAGMREAIATSPEMETAGPGMASWVEEMTFGETLPVLTNVFLGPPDRTVWVRRGIGVDDDLAPPVGDDLEAWELQLYDLFDGDSYEYIGTVEIPEDLTLMAGDSDRVAGVHTDELGVPSVRVLRVEIER